MGVKRIVTEPRAKLRPEPRHQFTRALSRSERCDEMDWRAKTGSGAPQVFAHTRFVRGCVKTPRITPTGSFLPESCSGGGASLGVWPGPVRRGLGANPARQPRQRNL